MKTRRKTSFFDFFFCEKRKKDGGSSISLYVYFRCNNTYYHHHHTSAAMTKRRKTSFFDFFYFFVRNGKKMEDELSLVVIIHIPIIIIHLLPWRRGGRRHPSLIFLFLWGRNGIKDLYINSTCHNSVYHATYYLMILGQSHITAVQLTNPILYYILYSYLNLVSVQRFHNSTRERFGLLGHIYDKHTYWLRFKLRFHRYGRYGKKDK